MLAVAIQTNGQIIVGGGGCSGRFVLVRFNADGSLDTAHFGSGGIEVGADINAAFSMTMTATGETVLIGRSPTDSDSIILQDFNTLAATQILYVECDADYNVTSLTDNSGNVLERYEYDPYGNVTVLNADGSVRGDGTAASSFYESDYLYQGMRYSVSTGTYASETRIYRPSLGRWLTEDPDRYIDGANMAQLEEGKPISRDDPSGLQGMVDQPQPFGRAPKQLTGDDALRFSAQYPHAGDYDNVVRQYEKATVPTPLEIPFELTVITDKVCDVWKSGYDGFERWEFTGNWHATDEAFSAGMNTFIATSPIQGQVISLGIQKSPLSPLQISGNVWAGSSMSDGSVGGYEISPFGIGGQNNMLYTGQGFQFGGSSAGPYSLTGITAGPLSKGAFGLYAQAGKQGYLEVGACRSFGPVDANYGLLLDYNNLGESIAAYGRLMSTGGFW